MARFKIDVYPKTVRLNFRAKHTEIIAHSNVIEADEFALDATLPKILQSRFFIRVESIRSEPQHFDTGTRYRPSHRSSARKRFRLEL